jgi:ABC-2 type transport system permease protein
MKDGTKTRGGTWRIVGLFLANSLMRDMTYRLNFVMEAISSLAWTMINLSLYLLIFTHVNQIGAQTGWGKWEFMVFLATTWIINSLIQSFFMPNCEEFAELIRTGRLDFALLKPIDTQLLVSVQRVEWSGLSNFVAGLVLLGVSVYQLATRPTDPVVISPLALLMYPIFIVCGVAILYSLMISLSATSIWLGRNTSLHDFWFYITSFSRYPREIYEGGRFGTPVQFVFTFLIPVLVVINVPAKLLSRSLTPTSAEDLGLAIFTLAAAGVSFLLSRWIFGRALASYRSASS